MHPRILLLAAAPWVAFLTHCTYDSTTGNATAAGLDAPELSDGSPQVATQSAAHVRALDLVYGEVARGAQWTTKPGVIAEPLDLKFLTQEVKRVLSDEGQKIDDARLRQGQSWSADSVATLVHWRRRDSIKALTNEGNISTFDYSTRVYAEKWNRKGRFIGGQYVTRPKSVGEDFSIGTTVIAALIRPDVTYYVKGRLGTVERKLGTTVPPGQVGPEYAVLYVPNSTSHVLRDIRGMRLNFHIEEALDKMATQGVQVGATAERPLPHAQNLAEALAVTGAIEGDNGGTIAGYVKGRGVPVSKVSTTLGIHFVAGEVPKERQGQVVESYYIDSTGKRS